jgi:hypothetical protein
MLSWQIMFHKEFPLLIGYWLWIAAGIIALGLATTARSRATGRPWRTLLSEPIVLLGFFAPIANAVLGVVTGGFK